MKELSVCATVLIAAVATVSCAPKPAQPAANVASATSAPKPVATIQEIMDAQVDPAADVIWGSVATSYDVHGTTVRQPRTAEDWQNVRRGAINLIEGMNLVAMQGRHAAVPSAEADRLAIYGILTPQQVQAKLDSQHAAFDAYALALQEIGRETLQIVDRKDVAGLQDIGEKIDNACEACHTTFWYPNEPKPKLTE